MANAAWHHLKQLDAAESTLREAGAIIEALEAEMTRLRALLCRVFDKHGVLEVGGGVINLPNEADFSLRLAGDEAFLIKIIDAEGNRADNHAGLQKRIAALRG